ncbi:MAG: hypothetical protein H6683_07495 [Deltaproteobacteria bacterium]|nr:hypothetical protein [Deltaproteobacteria bacterium]
MQEGVDLIKGSKHQVYIAAGTYTESVSIAKKYIELFGGYDASDWSRDIDAHETTIEGAGNPAVTIQKDAEETRLDGLTLDGPEASVSTAVSVATNEVVDVLRCRIRTFATKNTATGIMSDFAPTLRVLESQIVADENGGDIYGIDLTDEAEGGSLVVNGLEVTATLKGDGTFHGIRIEGMDSASIARTSVTVSDTTTGFLTGILGISTPMEVRASTINLAGSGSVRGIFSQSAKLESIDNVIRVTGYIFGLGIAVNSADGVVSGNGIEATGEALSTGIVLDGTTEDQFVLLNNIVHAAPSGSSGNNFTLRVSDMKGIASNNVFVAGEGINVFAARLEPSHDPSNKPGDVTLFNNIFISEQASSEGAPLQVYANPGGATPVIVLRNNDLIGDQPDCFMDTQVGSGCVETLADLNECNWPYCDDASDNIDDGPMFVDSDNGDYHLSSDSPLIDAGLDVTATLPSDLLDFALYDFENDPRPMGDGWDIGADEYHP